jgi:hypothetical protein
MTVTLELLSATRVRRYVATAQRRPAHRTVDTCSASYGPELF